MLIDVSKDDPQKIIHFASDFATQQSSPFINGLFATPMGPEKLWKIREHSPNPIQTYEIEQVCGKRTADLSIRDLFPLAHFCILSPGFERLRNFAKSRVKMRREFRLFIIHMWAKIGRVTFGMNRITIENCINLFVELEQETINVNVRLGYLCFYCIYNFFQYQYV